MKQLPRITLALAALLSTAAQAQAATVLKNSSGTDLAAGASWAGGNAPGVGDVATWDSTSLGAGLTLGSPASWASISVTGGLSDIGVTGAGPLTLGTSGIDLSLSTNNLSLGTRLTLGANQTWTVNTNRTLTGSGPISGSASLTTTGSGTVVLASTNSYSGGTTVNGGTLKAGTTNCFGPNNSAITINSGGTLDLNGIALGGLNGTSNYNVTVSGAGLGGRGAIVNSGANQTRALSSVALSADATIGGPGPAWGALGGGVQGNGHNLTFVGSSGIYFGGSAGALTNLQNIYINGGYVTIQQTATVDNNTPGSIYLNSGGTLRLGLYGTAAANLKILKPIVMAGGILGTDNTGANGNATVAAGITLNATGVFAPQSTSTLTLNGPIANGTANAVTFNAAISGAGTTVLTATNTYSGATTINAGTVMGVVGGSCSNSVVTVAATSGKTAVLGVSITDNTKQWTCAGVAVNNAGTSSGLDFNFGTVTPSGALAPLNVLGTATFTTTPAVTVEGSSFGPAGTQYPLMTWKSISGAAPAAVTVTAPRAVTAHLAVSGNTLNLVIDSNLEPLTWASSGTGTWNTDAANTVWRDSSGAAAAYSQATTPGARWSSAMPISAPTPR